MEGPRALVLAASFLRWGWQGVVLPLCRAGRGGRPGAGPRGVRRDEVSRRHPGGTSRNPRACRDKVVHSHSGTSPGKTYRWTKSRGRSQVNE
jgi:hypothetical protein